MRQFAETVHALDTYFTVHCWGYWIWI